MKRYETAVTEFLGGYRCSQAVLSVFAKDFDMDVDLARKISLPMAGGSGIGGECGAVGGAYLVLGLKYGFTHPGDPDRMSEMFDKVKHFVDQFKALHGQIDCPRLIDLDIFSEQGHARFVENKVKETTCARFVEDAVKILEGMLADEG